jgi:hypothetical protein
MEDAELVPGTVMQQTSSDQHLLVFELRMEVVSTTGPPAEHITGVPSSVSAPQPAV